MKRDWDLVRGILLKIEALPAESFDTVRSKDFPEYDARLVNYHLEMLNKRGLIEGMVEHVSAGIIADARTLTWEGQDFLDAIRDESVWKKIRKVLKKQSLTFDLVKQLGVKLLAELII